MKRAKKYIVSCKHRTEFQLTLTLQIVNWVDIIYHHIMEKQHNSNYCDIAMYISKGNVGVYSE